MTTKTVRVRVLIVEDHPILLAGIREMLRDSDSIEVVGEAENAVDALRLSTSVGPDVILLDMRLSHKVGSTLMADTRRACPLIEFVALADSDDAGDFRYALGQGAHGYVLDNASRADICDAVRRVAAGRSHIDPAMSGLLMRPSQDHSSSDEPALTRRELDTLRLAAQGLTNGAIAQRLGLGTETVKTHLAHAFERLGARDRANAVAICMRRDLF